MMWRKREFLRGLMMGVLFSALAACWFGPSAKARPDEPAARDDLDELKKLYDEDQADRKPKDGQAIDWSVVGPRDRQREARVKALYETGEIRTGKDFHRAAMVLQHASKPEDYLLAHEFCVVALASGERDARWLAAATEDRFLMNINRSQRFGTQYRSSGEDRRLRLYEVDVGVTDALRRELAVPTLAEAREREAKMNEAIKGTKPPASKPGIE